MYCENTSMIEAQTALSSSYCLDLEQILALHAQEEGVVVFILLCTSSLIIMCFLWSNASTEVDIVKQLFLRLQIMCFL